MHILRNSRCLIPEFSFSTEVVDALVYRGVVKTRKDAVYLGRILAKEFNLFSHVCGDHSFCDKMLFYRFNESFADCFQAGAVGDDMSSKRNVPVGELGSYADAFRRVVDVRDRTSRMQTYRSCFVGSEAVDALVFAAIAATREDAVKLGRELQKELRLFKHVSSKALFRDDDTLYRFRENNLDDSLSDVENSIRVVGNDMDIRSTMVEIAETFRQCVEVKDRKYRFRTYKKCFVGHDAIDSMLDNNLVCTRKQGVELGRYVASWVQLAGNCFTLAFADLTSSHLYGISFFKDTCKGVGPF